MIGPQNECFRIADHDIQSMKQTENGIVGLMLVRKIFQGWYVTVITVSADHVVLWWLLVSPCYT